MNGESTAIVNAESILHDIEILLKEIESGIHSENGRGLVQKKIKNVTTTINRFEATPKLLDSKLEWLVKMITLLYLQTKRTNGNLLNDLAECFYQLTKVRGYKFVVNFCSNDVYLIPELLSIISGTDMENDDCQCFLLLLWLSRLAMVPFQLLNIEESLAEKLFQLSNRFLVVHSSASRTQIASLYLLSNLIIRLDCTSLLKRYVLTIADDWSYMSNNIKLGHLLALNQILKNKSNVEIAHLIPVLQSSIIDYEVIQIRHNRRHSLNTVNVLYIIKVSTKLANFYIRTNDFERVSGIVNYILLDIMNSMSSGFDAKLRECTAKSITKIVTSLSLKAVNYASQLIWFMIDQLKIHNLKLNHKFQKDVEINPLDFQVDKYHTILLFLAFLGMEKSVPLEVIPTAFSIVHKTIFISDITFSHVKGSQIRDASCFCIWALCRKLKQNDYESLCQYNPEMMQCLLLDIIKVIVFDADFTIRRCGIAVLQEFVGRFGNMLFQHLLPGRTANEIGEFLIRFIEMFTAASVSRLLDSHKLIMKLYSLGFDKGIFVEPLLEEIIFESNVFETRKLGGIFLAELLGRDSSIACLNLPTEFPSTENVVSNISKAIKNGNYECFYALAEMVNRKLVIRPSIDLLEDKLFAPGHHPKAPERAESILHFLIALIEAEIAPKNETYLSEVLSLSRAQPTKSLSSEVKTYLKIIGECRRESITFHDFESICHQIARGNQLLAEGVTAFPVNNQQLELLLLLIEDFSIDPDIRSILIKGIHAFLQCGFSAKIEKSILESLDDYKNTDQGDVGLKVRLATLSLLAENDQFALQLDRGLKRRLIRLSGESMDKLRIEAFKLLCKVDDIPDYKAHYETYMSNYELYFQDFYDYYLKYCDEKDQFWEGMVHSAGALTGSSDLINVSFRCVLSLCYYSSESDVEEMLAILFRMLKTPTSTPPGCATIRHQKTTNCALMLVGKLLEAEVELPKNTNYEVLYVRTYNLHIKGANVKRMGLALKIFQHLSTSLSVASDIQQKCRKRIWWLASQHKSATVRVMASKSLFEILNELDPTCPLMSKIDTCDWRDQEEASRLQVESTILGLRCI